MIPDNMTPPGSPCSLGCQSPGCLDVYNASMTWACVMQDDPGHNLICLRGFGLAVSLRAHRSPGYTVSLLERPQALHGQEMGLCVKGERGWGWRRNGRKWEWPKAQRRSYCLCKQLIGPGETTYWKRNTLGVLIPEPGGLTTELT